jgi:polar amino acid transport system substrate-binding protein
MFVRRGAILTMVSACAIAAAGCGAVKADSADAATKKASPNGPSSAAAGSLHSTLPDSVKASGTIKIATGASYPPDQYVDTDGKTIVGWSVDILNEVGKRLDVKMDIANLDFPGILPAIQADKFDIGSSSYAVTPDRLEAVDFVTYYQNGQYIAVAKGNPGKIDATDVCGKSMAVTQGSLSEKTAVTLTEECKASGKPALKVQAFANASAVYLAIASGRAETTVVNGSTLGNLPKDIEQIGESFLPRTVGFIFAKNDPQLRDAVHQALQAMIDDGTYLEILKKWKIENGALKASEVKS